MNKTSKKIMFQSAIALVLIFSLSIFGYSYLTYNWRECLNTPDCTCTITLQDTTPTLKTYITESAGNFFNSHSSFQAFLNRVELAEIRGINANELKDIFYSAIENMEKAKSSYESFKIASAKTSYNQEMIDKLMKFDYDGFQRRYGLVEPIFERVKLLLINGDITGLDNTVLLNMDSILKQLNTAKSIVDKDLIPEVSILWRINQSYLEAHLFGQYMSEVFKDIIGI